MLLFHMQKYSRWYDTATLHKNKHTFPPTSRFMNRFEVRLLLGIKQKQRYWIVYVDTIKASEGIYEYVVLGLL